MNSIISFRIDFIIIIKLINRIERKIFKNVFPENRFELTGEVRRMIPVISKIEIMTDLPLSRLSELIHPEIVVVNSEVIYNNYRIIIIYSEMGSFGSDLFLTTGPEDFVEKFKILTAGDENKVFELNSLPVLMPHLRDNENIYHYQNPWEFTGKLQI